MVEGGFDLSWAWGIGLISFAFGITAGIAGLYLMTGNRQRIKDLESQLASAQQQFDNYREQVGQHFLKTSDLVQKMTSSYRDVYEHLASGSQALCTDPVSTPQLDIPHRPTLNQNENDGPAEPGEPVDNEFSDTDADPLQKTDAADYLADSPNISDLSNETRH